MTDEKNSPQTKDVNKEAAALARSEGVDWKNLAQEQRRDFKLRVRRGERRAEK